MTRLQDRLLDLVKSLTPGRVETPTGWPIWLQRPGRLECGAMWDTVNAIYQLLMPGVELPEVMPLRESRSVDAILIDHDGRTRILEVDETQHFNLFRASTFKVYPPDAKLAFSREIWRSKSTHSRKLPGGGFGRAKPPLFAFDGGRHRQRAFRNATADLLPSEYGFARTLRLAHVEL